MDDSFTAAERSGEDQGNGLLSSSSLIMVVENDQDTLLLISELLKDLGYKVIEASNGSEALEKIVLHKPVLILMDIEMPVLNGYDATLALRKMEAPFCNIPVIATTAYATNEDRKKYKEAGIDQVIPKPFHLEEIERKLKQRLPAGVC